MDEKMLAEFSVKCCKNHEKLIELLAAYDLAVLGYDLQNQRCDDVTELVLSKHEFFATREFSRYPENVKIGDRVLKEEYTFLLSDEDFHRLHELTKPILVEQKITDEKGYFLEDWHGMKTEAWRNLVDFIILNIIPDYMREIFWAKRWSVVFGDKLIDVFRKSLKAA